MNRSFSEMLSTHFSAKKLVSTKQLHMSERNFLKHGKVCIFLFLLAACIEIKQLSFKNFKEYYHQSLSVVDAENSNCEHFFCICKILRNCIYFSNVREDKISVLHTFFFSFYFLLFLVPGAEGSDDDDR